MKLYTLYSYAFIIFYVYSPYHDSAEEKKPRYDAGGTREKNEGYTTGDF